MKNLLFFSHNNKKVSEVEKILSRKDIKIYNLNFYNKIKEPIESGKSFAENAKIKSYCGLKKFKIPCFADDSGICIEALNNKPGTKSKRFLEGFETYQSAFEYIISNVINKKNDKAFFKTAICLSIKKNYHIVFEGVVGGRITTRPKGVNGFGYDPIFIPKGKKLTFGQMKPTAKYKIDHRMMAFKKIKKFL